MVELHDVQVVYDGRNAQAALEGGQVMLLRQIDVAAGMVQGRRVLFATDKKRDPIQRQNRHAQFYEEEELALLADIVPPGAVFVDIGANVGNHSVYAAIFLNAAKVIPVEPNPLAYRLLVANVVLNDLSGVVALDHIGIGLSDSDGAGFGMTDRHKNLGAARMVEGAGGIPVTTGDKLLAGEMPDFIKIDVEGMEMKALHGLSETIARARPKMLIEVDRENYDTFEEWRVASGYRIDHMIQRYAVNKNFLVSPEGTG